MTATSTKCYAGSSARCRHPASPTDGWKIGSAALSGDYVDDNRLGAVVSGDVGFILARDPDTVLAPDIAFVRADRLPPDGEQEGYLPLAPDLVVEIVSPSDRAAHVHDNVMFYLEAGVLAVWVLDPSRRAVTVRRPDRVARILTIDETLDGGDVLPGFRLPLAQLFT